MTFFNQYILIILISLFFLSSCKALKPKWTDSRKVPVQADERARKNIEEGRGISIGSVIKRGGTNYEFSTSNPMWRATFDVIDFMPLVTVDYSGGTIITDWYTDNKSPNESLKFTIRFLSNEIRSDSVKVIIHRKTCKQQGTNCIINKISSKLESEIRTSIIKKAALYQVQSKNSQNKKIKKKKGRFGTTKSSIEELEELNRKQKRESGR